MNFKHKTALFFATGFYSGNIPFAPGTFGSLVGLLFCYILSLFDFSTALIITLCLIGFSIIISDIAEKALGKKDPGCIVIDEIAGMAVTLLGISFTLKYIVIGFIVFRVLDILKPFPIGFIDRKTKGGFGIVADDVVAGLAANMILNAIRFLVT